MNAIASSLHSGLGTLQRALGSPAFDWKGQSIPCVPAALLDANSPIPGGFQDNATCRVLVRFTDWKRFDSTLVTMDSTLFTVDQGTNFSMVLRQDDGWVLLENNGGVAMEVGKPVPVVGRLLTYNGRVLRILTCKIDASGGFYSLDLGAKTK